MNLRDYAVLGKNDNAFVITNDGEFVEGIARKPSELLENADALQAIMIEGMKIPGSIRGKYLWRISRNWSSLERWYLEDF